MLLFLLAAPVMAARAQSNQELLEAYRNGTLTQSQIDELKAKNADKTKEDNSTQKDRRRSVNAATANGVNVGQADVNADVRSGLPTDPQEGLVEGIGLGDRRDSIATIAKAPRRIFGHDLFTNSRLTFEPNLSIATPDNYVLGPGDEVIIDVWGDSQMTIEATVSPDGKIFVSNVGPVTLAGLAISEAAQRLRGSLAAIYEGLYDGSVKMKLSLGSIRSIQVNVAGEVASSGTYTLPSLATLFHALHMAGGVEQLGTLRSIKVYRGGKLFSDVDVYDYILNGKTDKDIALRDGDLELILHLR